ncbi:TPA: hypothetical protein ACPSKY_002773 [Legionella bozemanae]
MIMTILLTFIGLFLPRTVGSILGFGILLGWQWWSAIPAFIGFIIDLASLS